MRIIFVDGYNVINSWPNLKCTTDEGIDGSRKKLIDIMHTYESFYNCKVKVVFDAYKVNGNLEKIEIVSKNLEVIFTKDGETADSYIERKVHELGRKYEVYVVTSDGLEQQTIFQRGAVRVTTLEFYNEIIDMENRIRKETQENIINTNKNHLQDNINSEIRKKLEEIRRSE